MGRLLWRFCIVVLLALGTISAGALSAVTLWVLFRPVEPPGLSFEPRKSESAGRIGGLDAADASRQGSARGAESRPGASSADAAETQTEAVAGAGQPRFVQDGRPAAGSLTDSRPYLQCEVDLCAAKYASFRAADCTYQPHGGGPRQICERSTRAADTRRQASPATTDARPEANDARSVERPAEVAKSTMPARAEAQCNVNLCAAKYSSFDAADCTYKPYGGGQRRMCER